MNSNLAPGAVLKLENSIVMGDPLATEPACVNVEASADNGYNADNDGSCNFSAVNHSLSDNAGINLGSLANNGGSTLTIGFSWGSSAIGSIPLGVNRCGGITDQRGIFPCAIAAPLRPRKSA